MTRFVMLRVKEPNKHIPQYLRTKFIIGELSSSFPLFILLALMKSLSKKKKKKKDYICKLIKTKKKKYNFQSLKIKIFILIFLKSWL